MVTNHDTVAGIFGRPGYWETRCRDAEAERDALRLLSVEQAAAIADLRPEVVRLRDIISKAPHDPGCATKDYHKRYAYPECNCWKSRIEETQ